MTIYIIVRIFYRAHDPPITDFIEACKNEKTIFKAIKKHFKSLNRPDLILDVDIDNEVESLGLDDLDFGDIVEYSFINPKLKSPYASNPLNFLDDEQKTKFKTESFISYGVIKTLLKTWRGENESSFKLSWN